MTKEEILHQLYEKYIEPTKKKRDRFIGVEIEMPIVNLEKRAVDFSVIHSLTGAFCAHFDFSVTGIDDEGNTYAAQRKSNSDILSYDCSYNNLELSFGREQDLNEIHRRFHEYYGFIQAYLEPYHYTLTGMGVNPYRVYNHNIPIPNGRYRMLFHHLHSYEKYAGQMDFHPYPAFGTFSSASQVQLDVDFEKLPQTLNVMNRIEPLKALLFSNSPLPKYDPDLLCCRDMFWEKSTHGLNPKNIGMYDIEFRTAEDVLRYIADTSIYCVERGDKYINFAPIKITDYLLADAVEGEYFDGEEYRKITIHPEPEDIAYLRTFKFEDLTYRGTIEFRSACTQPVGCSMALSAFHVGLMNRIDALTALLNKDTAVFKKGYTPTELRKLFIKRPLPSFIDVDELYLLLRRIVDLAYDGLIRRGKGEERFLEPLYMRIQNRTNPALDMLADLEKGTPLEELIKANAT